MEHTVEVCPAWAEYRRVLVKAVGGGDFSHPVLVEAMVRGSPEVWEAVTFFCEGVMLVKEETKRLRERLIAGLRLRFCVFIFFRHDVSPATPRRGVLPPRLWRAHG